MASRFTFIVHVELERDEGLFAARDDLADLLRTEIEGADPGSVDPNESTYSVTDWTVDDFDPKEFDAIVKAGTEVLRQRREAAAARKAAKASS